jgi:hypothetical protein
MTLGLPLVIADPAMIAYDLATVCARIPGHSYG